MEVMNDQHCVELIIILCFQGYMRKGHALQGMKRYEEAMGAFLAGLDLEPGNTAMEQGLKECKSHLTGI